MKNEIVNKIFNLEFAAKVRWRMKYDRNPILTIIQDKFSVRKYAKEKGIEAAKLIYSTKNPESISFDDLPENCFIKANHGCEWNILRLNSQLYYFKNGIGFENYLDTDFNFDSISKFMITESECINYCNKWLSQKYLQAERQADSQKCVIRLCHDGRELRFKLPNDSEEHRLPYGNIQQVKVTRPIGERVAKNARLTLYTSDGPITLLDETLGTHLQKVDLANEIQKVLQTTAAN